MKNTCFRIKPLLKCQHDHHSKLKCNKFDESALRSFRNCLLLAHTPVRNKRLPSMNWMTGGKHRALYSQRGQRRQMHFPSQVQRQRVKPSSPPRSAQPAAAARARDSTTPWYIVQVGDDTQSQGRERAHVPVGHWTLRVTFVVTMFWCLSTCRHSRAGARAAESKEFQDCHESRRDEGNCCAGGDE